MIIQLTVEVIAYVFQLITMYLHIPCIEQEQ